MNILRQALKNTALRTLRSAGVYSMAANSRRRAQSLLILCYHGLAMRDENEWAGHLFITVDRFRQRLACLRDMKATVLPLGESLHRLRNGTLPQRSVAITFDDGFYDFLHHGVPALNDFGFPATLYLTTYYSGRRFPIVNLVLDYILWKSGHSFIEFPELGLPTPQPVRDWRERREMVGHLLEWCETNHLDTFAKNDFVRALSTRIGIDYDDLLRSRVAQIMTPEEAVAVARAGIDIQLHTHRHRTPRDRELFLREIGDNAGRIAAITGKRPAHFCYPSGVYEDDFIPWLRECGIQSATTCERGFARSSSDPLLLPRLLDDSNMDIVQFEGFVSGLFA